MRGLEAERLSFICYNGGMSISIKDTLSTNQTFDPYLEYHTVPIEDLVTEIEALLRDKDEVAKISDDPLYRQNLLSVVQFAYFKVLADKKAVVQPTQQVQRSSLFSSASLNTLYSMPA